MISVMAGSLEAHPAAPSLIADFGRWMTTEQRRVFLLCYRMLRDPEEADTAAQDAFLKAYKVLRRPGAPEIDDPGKWITRIAVNTCLDRMRSRTWKFWKKRPGQEDEEVILRMASTSGPTAEDEVFARQIDERLRAALEQLSPRQRAVFLLRHYEDRRLEEIAEILGLDLGTVKAHMARALAKLRDLLRDLYIESHAGAKAQGGLK